jgi:hypothetical protein
MLSWVAGLCFVVSVFVVFFLYVTIGMASGEAQANTFLAVVLAVGAIIAAGVYFSRRWWKEEQ